MKKKKKLFITIIKIINCAKWWENTKTYPNTVYVQKKLKTEFLVLPVSAYLKNLIKNQIIKKACSGVTIKNKVFSFFCT